MRFALTNNSITLIAMAVVALGLVPSMTAADVVSFTQPTLDRWMYPFNATPGTRDRAGTFGAPGTAGFDDRDAQALLGFDTQTAGVPTSQGSANYQVNSAVLTITIVNTASFNNTFNYDPTYDAFGTYVSDPDADTGRPIELHGAGFRNGYTALSYGPNDGLPPGFEEASPFSPPGPPAENVRNAYALGFDGVGTPRDVSNNVEGLFDSNPWAIGSAGLNPGDLVPQGTQFSFSIDLSNPFVLDYVQDGLNAGSLGLVLTSLHTAALGGPVTYPNFYLKESLDLNSVPATLSINYTLVPEPSALSLGSLAAIAIGSWSVLRRRAKRKEVLNG